MPHPERKDHQLRLVARLLCLVDQRLGEGPVGYSVAIERDQEEVTRVAAAEVVDVDDSLTVNVERIATVMVVDLVSVPGWPALTTDDELHIVLEHILQSYAGVSGAVVD